MGWDTALREDRQEEEEEVMAEEEVEEDEEEDVRGLPVTGPWFMTEPRCTNAAGEMGGVMRGQLI